MWLTIADLLIPPVSHDFVRAAFANMEGLEGPGIAGWWPTSAETQPYWWYGGVRLFRRNDSTAVGMVGNVSEGDNLTESHIVVNGETAAKLDAIFAADESPSFALADAATTIAFGNAQLHTRTLVKAALDPLQSVWVYEFAFYAPETYRTTITRRHAGPWLDVMLDDTYPREGSPLTAGPTLHDRAAETTYVYANNNAPASGFALYAGTFDVQLDSGCRYGASLELETARDGVEQWGRVPPRFWTLAEALKVSEQEWEKYAGRIIFGGRQDLEQLAGIYPKTFTAEYQLPTVPPSPPPPPSEYVYTTGTRLASGHETFDLGNVEDDSAIESQVQRMAEWEAHSRRHFVTVFLGLVPWQMTPLDNCIEWRLPIDGLQKPVTILYGVEGRTDVSPLPEVANPAPDAGTITVTFDRLAPGFPGTRQPVGQLTRDGYGSSDPFVPPAVIDGTAVYVYDNLADGSYTVTPGSDWSPSTITVVVANGSSETMDFSYVIP